MDWSVIVHGRENDHSMLQIRIIPDWRKPTPSVGNSLEWGSRGVEVHDKEHGSMPVQITGTAAKEIGAIIKQQDLQADVIHLRVGVKGGGCSGFMYKYEFAQEPDEKDKVFEFDDVKICIDIKSYLFLNGMEIDYEEDILKSGLVFV